MIEFSRAAQQTIPSSLVKIVGLGGAGASMLDRIALDGMEGAELLAVNTDIRTLSSSVAGEKVQLGRNLTKGLGTGGDPALGQQAMQEAESEVRDALRDHRIVFICVGLGGGTGSGAAPLVTRIAREQGAFVVVFATMPFVFEGERRRQQAEEALNQLAVLSNALVTFDNGRMGELVLAKQGIHEAFAAGDRMISESIKAVTRLVVRPGLINVGLDELMSALRTSRSRCLFGSGLARGKDRSHQALKNALNSPLLDQGSLLRDAETVLVHICGGEDMTLYEIELLMEKLGKHVSSKAHILFGAAVDPALGDGLTVTLISSLPENKLHAAAGAALVEKAPKEEPARPVVDPGPAVEEEFMEPSEGFGAAEEFEIAASGDVSKAAGLVEKDAHGLAEPAGGDALVEVPGAEVQEAQAAEPMAAVEPVVKLPLGKSPERVAAAVGEPSEPAPQPVVEPVGEVGEPSEPAPQPVVEPVVEPGESPAAVKRRQRGNPQGELALDGGPRGKFEGESPNVFEGEDLDIPPFLRQRR
jgi:cell division protein FtsZ